MESRKLFLFISSTVLLAALFFNPSRAFDCATNKNHKNHVVRTIVVDHRGHGHYTKIQHAINSVPNGNKQWIGIHVSAGRYIEKVTIGPKKTCIFLYGAGIYSTVVEWGDHGDISTGYTFSTAATNIIVKGITFKNTYNLNITSHKRAPVEQAVAAVKCAISVSAEGYGKRIQFGYITAQRRESASEPGGFVFKYCYFGGSTKAYLGRPWGPYARVLVYSSYLSDNIIPKGWSTWSSGKFIEQKHDSVFSEHNCYGPGSNTGQRVPWEKKLSGHELMKLVNTSYINSDRWLEKLPHDFY
ncbi:hypothetical protein ACFE04_017864 [Oxalis oulophora]